MAHPVARPRRLLALAATVVAALSLAGVAQAQTYTLVASDVQVDVRPDGSVAVDEDITVAFSGSFTYGFREIPLRSGERLDEVGVSEKGSPYQPGASTELEPGGPPGTFGVEDLGGRTRVVWRFESDGFQERTFRVHYRLSGLAVGYDDVVDVNLKVWGDEWEQRLGRLTATMRGPGDVIRAWGHPVWVRGDVTLQGRNALLRALDVDAGQFVELRALYPRDAFTSTGGMQVREGDGLQAIIAEETADAADYERDKERIDDAISSPWRWLLLLLLLGTLPALVIGGFVFWRFGRELSTGYDREYEQEPPTETAPALVPTLLRQGGEAGSFEFTATLFDLIRRGHYKAEPVVTERSIWGGLRTERVSDLELSPGTPVELTTWESSVTRVVDDILSDGSVRLSKFRGEIESERTEMAPRFEGFKEAVGGEVTNLGWFRSIGVVPLVAGVLVFGAARRAPRVHRDRRLARRVSPLERRRPARARGGGVRQRGGAARCDHAPEALASANARRSARGRALGGVPELPAGLPAAPGGTAGDARALGALPRLRDRVRDRRPCAPGRAHRDARGDGPGELDLLDLGGWRPRERRLGNVDRRPRIRVRLRARATLVRLWRRWGRLLGRWRRGRWRRWRRLRLVPTGHLTRTGSAGTLVTWRTSPTAPRSRCSLSTASGTTSPVSRSTDRWRRRGSRRGRAVRPRVATPRTARSPRPPRR